MNVDMMGKKKQRMTWSISNVNNLATWMPHTELENEGAGAGVGGEKMHSGAALKN